MIKFEVTGNSNEVESFLVKLKQQPFIESFQTSSSTKEGNIGEIRCTVCLNHEPSQGIKTVELDTQNGQKILISLSKVIQSEIEEGKWYLLGWNYDIFACRERSEGVPNWK